MDNKQHCRGILLFLVLCAAACLLVGQVCATGNEAVPAQILDGILPDEHYHPGSTTTATDPADGMPEEGRVNRFGEEPDQEDSAAGGGTTVAPGARVAPTATVEGISPWIAILVVSLAAAAVVIAVLYLVPKRKDRK